MLRMETRYFLLGCSLVLALVLSATADAEFPTGLSSPNSRQQLYEQLAADAEAFEQKHNLLKRVVQLARPTVVHLEAEREDPGPAKKGTDEAGSGIVVQWDSKYYVVTNRHVVRDAPLQEFTFACMMGECSIRFRFGQTARQT
jgi:S1-C subfamily serine protease